MKETKKIVIISIIAMFALLVSFTGCDFINGVIGGETDETSVKNYLGQGYDFFDEYANAKQVKESLLDYDAMYDDGIIDIDDNLGEAKLALAYGDNSKDYQKSYNAQIGVSGNYAGFTASVSTAFGEDASSSATTAFASLIGNFPKLKANIQTSSITYDSLSPYMTSKFKSSFNSITASSTNKDIIDNIYSIYGTHIITGSMLGGRLEYTKSTNSQSISSAASFALGVNAGYSSVAGDGAELSTYVSSNTAATEAANSAKANVLAYGGLSEWATLLATEGGFVADNYNPWIESLSDETNWSLCGFAFSSSNSKDGLCPIYELCEDSEIKALFISAFDEYANTKAVKAYTASTKYTVTLELIQIDASGMDDGIWPDGSSEIDGSITAYKVESDKKVLFSSDDFIIQDGASTITQVSTSRSTVSAQSFETTNLEDSITIVTNFVEDDSSGNDPFYEVKETKTFSELRKLAEKTNKMEQILLLKAENNPERESSMTFYIHVSCKTETVTE